MVEIFPYQNVIYKIGTGYLKYEVANAVIKKLSKFRLSRLAVVPGGAKYE
jgi:hypothetical protein